MTEKVKLTLEQAQSIKAYDGDEEGKTSAIKLHIKKAFLANYSLNRLTLDELIRALYIGYEVEPEYSKGEIVKWYGEIVEIMHPQTDDHIDDGNCYFTIKRSDDTTMNNVERQKLQKTTTSEKGIYKERQKWAKIGRKPDEYHHYDIAYDHFNGCHVEVDDPTIFATPYIRVANLGDKSDSREIDPVDLTLVCPGDKRFDHD